MIEKILIITNDNKILLDGLEDNLIYSNDINLQFKKGVLVVKLKNDYKNLNNIKIGTKNGKINYYK